MTTTVTFILAEWIQLLLRLGAHPLFNLSVVRPDLVWVRKSVSVPLGIRARQTLIAPVVLTGKVSVVVCMMVCVSLLLCLLNLFSYNVKIC